MMNVPGGVDRDNPSDDRGKDSTVESDSAIRTISLPAKVAALLVSNPPEISEKKEQVSGIQIIIPLGGKRWKRISAQTGFKTTAEMTAALVRIAREEHLDWTVEYDDDDMATTVKLSRKPGYPYEKPIGKENIAVLNCFDFETF